MSEPNQSFCGPEWVVEHRFTFPGDYRVCVKAGDAENCTTLQNRYVHREVMALTQTEFDEFAHAFNVVRRMSTEDGRAAFGHQCLGDESDYYTHDSYVALHTFLSSFRDHDRLHYITLQEPAHFAWTQMMQKALRCVNPSVSHPYYDPVKDVDHYYDSTLGSLLTQSPVWGSSRYGGASNHFAADDVAYVKDGRFTNFPITQRQDAAYWCDPLREMSSEELYDACNQSLALRTAAWATGITLMQPKPKEHLQYVSRRPYFYMGSQTYCLDYVETLRQNEERVRQSTSLGTMWGIVSSSTHSFGHQCISGKWTHDGRWLGSHIATGNDKAVNIGMWFDPTNASRHPLVRCYRDRCECMPDAFLDDAHRWYYRYDDDSSRTGGTYERATTISLNRFIQGDCDWPKSGTFDWSASANQDPAFYAHHFYTFYQTDLGYKRLTALTGRSVVDLASEVFATEYERPGNNLNDVTHFRNLVPYTVGQTEGEYHTWSDILTYQTSYEDFVFESS